MNEYWFKPRSHGIGASPKTWEGWALTAVYLASIMGLAVWTAKERPADVTLGIALLTAVFVFVTWRKTEGGWRWRWGDDDK